MIRTSVHARKPVIGKLALRRETIRALGHSELEFVVGGQGTSCADSNRYSTCQTSRLVDDPGLMK